MATPRPVTFTVADENPNPAHEPEPFVVVGGFPAPAPDSTEDWTSGWVDAAFAKPRLSDVPVLTWQAAARTTALTNPVVARIKGTNGGTKITNWNGQDDPTFLISPGVFETKNGGSNDLGLYGMRKPGGNAQAASWPMIVSFVTSAVNVVEIAGFAGSNSNEFMIEVNGAFIDDYPSPRVPSGVSGAYMLTLTFPTAEVRQITIWDSGNAGFGEFRVPTGGTITKPAGPVRRRVAVIGDSYVNGAPGTGSQVLAQRGTNPLTTFAPRLARLMGADQVILAGIGGRGWVAGTDGGTPNPYSTIVPSVLSMSPHVIIFAGSINDGPTGAGVEQAVKDTLALCASVPEVYVIPPILSGYDANAAAVKAGTLAAGRTFIDMTNFLYGTGKVTEPKGDGNRDYYLMADGVHPNAVAHKEIARAAFGHVAPKTP